MNSSTTKAGGGGQRILLVEDEENVRTVVTQMLELHGFVVVAAEDAFGALSACRGSVPFDLMLTDIVMPTMTGIELSAAVRKMSPQVRTVYMSAYHDEDLDDRTPRLQKPFTSHELYSTLDDALLR